MQLLSLNLGKPAVVQYNGKPVETGIYKRPVEGAITLSSVQLEGDGQADKVNHGGEDKAVSVYCVEHYPYWRKELNAELPYGAFGENFTVAGMVETDVHIGDIFETGGALVQISLPRRPCFKLGVRHNRPDMPLLFQNTGYTGYYLRVLKEGAVTGGTPIRLVDRHPKAISVAEVNRLKYHDKDDLEAIKALLEVKELAEGWRESFRKRLDGSGE
ncbi:MOSC domain-containing protein [Paenibacillus sp. H1-7]|uniref:MOSC domain-containing protein n=1 Tax=Paenibacillus sp. H1-7 TaxID=2282849 RepID=UPI001EF7AEAA|nr:MOSC domain-containing protein [Paenibacillus sp. H1-7]ULL18700.1 MOSC domain-containing protein [Paenibacillus sp. H1-7]